MNRQSQDLLIPTVLLAETASLAVGMYAMLAWMWVSAQQHAAKILTRNTAAPIQRTLKQLRAQGWLVPIGTRAHELCPTWGTDYTGVPLHWRETLTDYGKPQHIQSISIDGQILQASVAKLNSDIPLAVVLQALGKAIQAHDSRAISVQEHEVATTWNSFVQELKQTGFIQEDSQPSTTAAEKANPSQASRWYKRSLSATLLKQLGITKEPSNA